MRPYVLIALVAVAATAWYPADAWSQGRLSAGAVLWRHDTNLDVDHATNFDGSDDTSDQMIKDWDELGSGAGVRLTYDFPKLVTLYGEGGVTQATVRDKDVTDPSQDIGSLGLNDGAYFSVGAGLAGDFSGQNLFWGIDGSYSNIGASLDEDVVTSWDYDESKFSLGGKLGLWVNQVGFFGGVRFVDSSADLTETDISNTPGQQTRTIQLKRENSADLVLGAQTRGRDVAGFAEMGLVGTFSATAGVRFGF